MVYVGVEPRSGNSYNILYQFFLLLLSFVVVFLLLLLFSVRAKINDVVKGG